MIVLVILAVSTSAYADKPAPAAAKAVATKWLTAMHAHDLDAAVGLVASPLHQNVCVNANNARIASDAAAARKRFQCALANAHSAFNQRSWTVARDVTLEHTPTAPPRDLSSLAARSTTVTATITAMHGDSGMMYRYVLAIDDNLRVAAIIELPAIVID